MKRNYSPIFVAVATSLAISILVLMIMIVLKMISNELINWWTILLVPGLLFIIAYLFIQYAIESFLNERIKLIYKSIYQFKSVKSDDAQKINLESDVLSQVEHDVKLWMSDKRSEIRQMKRAEEYRKQFLSNVSHELKTPIFSIMGYLETLSEGGIYDNEINMKYVERAITNTERLNEIIKDLDTISNLEGEMIELNLERINLKTLVEEVIESLQLLAYNYNISVEIDSGMDKSQVVLADKHRIKQVLTNLISNSIKYGNKGGVTTVSWFDMDENILIEVTDNGIGIEKDHIPRLFERFYRVDKNRSRERGGTGLGLSIVKHIIEAHKQTINVRSTPGLGSTFGFTLKKG